MILQGLYWAKLNMLITSGLMLVLAACGGGTVTMGFIEFSQGDPVNIELPEMVNRGEDFQVTVRTYAGGCEREISRTNVRIDDMEALIVPYNVKTNSQSCTADMLFLNHVATLSFEQVGTATITVRGRSRVQGGTINVVRTVTVQ